MDFLNFSEARALAKRRLPRGIFEYVDRGAEDEIGLQSNRTALDSLRILPRACAGGAARDLEVSILGERMTAPFIVAPTAFAGLMWHDGELALAKAAAARGLPFCAATEAITGVEDIARESRGPVWLQLYLWEQEGVTKDFLDRAWKSGVRVLVVTVDTAVSANREYNTRNGFGMPFRFSPGNIADVLAHPRWALGVLGRYVMAGNIPACANLPPEYRSNIFASRDHIKLVRGLSWDHIRQLRDIWQGRLILKGVLRVDDAVQAADLAADGIVVSNHGARQLDSAVTPVEVLPQIADAVGDRLVVLADSGIRRGSDVLKLLALGAKGVLLGRSLLYGTAAGGGDGAGRMLDILRRELDMAMAMAGAPEISAITRDLVDYRF